MVALRAGAATDVGQVRSNNQDSFLMADPLYAVADGMGGAAAGEVASALAIEALGRGFHTADGAHTPDLLVEAARAANRAVWEEAGANPEMRGMGTTLVAVALVEGPQLAIINIGDSRLYLFHDDELRQVTVDHNLLAEMVAEGRISAAEAEYHPRRNIITRALGVEPDVPVDLFTEDPVPGDRYLLCSDGLPREVSDDRVASLLRRIADPAEAAKELVAEAKRNGGNDNITVVVVDVVDAAATPAAPGTPEGVAPPPDATTAIDGSHPTTVAPTVAAADTAGAIGAAAAPASPTETTGTTETAETTDTAGTAGSPGAGPPAAGRARRIRSAVTFRVVAFLLIVLIILGAAAVGIVWYARSAYFVGLRGQQIVIFQGRPGGVLGLDPTLKQATPYTTSSVLPSALPSLRAGQEEPSLGAARQYVANLVTAFESAQAAAAPPPTTAPTTAPVTTVKP